MGDLGASRLFRAVTLGALFEDAEIQPRVLTGRDLKPYAPWAIKAAKSGSPANTVLSWVRRTRLGLTGEPVDAARDVARQHRRTTGVRRGVGAPEPGAVRRVDHQVGEVGAVEVGHAADLERSLCSRGRFERDRILDQADYLARGDVDGYEAQFGKL